MASSTALLLGCITLVMFSAVLAADPDPLQDFTVPGKAADDVKVTDFVTDVGAKNFLNLYPAGFDATIITRANFSILGDQGISFAVLNFAPGFQNSPHEHPRATELFFVVRGEIIIGIADTLPNNPAANQFGPRFFTTTVKAGQLVVFPRGLPHFQINKSKKPALAVAALNSANPGAVRLQEVLAKFAPVLKY